MLMVISPAKSLDYETPIPTKKSTKPQLLNDSQELINNLKKLAPQEVSNLMSISDKLGVLNYDRFQAWQQPFPKADARQSVLAFKGDVYIGLNAYNFNEKDFAYAQEHLRILSGLYGLLRPLDSILPYRLEMGTKFSNERGKNLYDFWANKITDNLNKQIKKTESKALINLASNEYFKSVNASNLNADIITPVFKDWKGDKYKIISFYAKKARGLMSAYVIKKQLKNPAAIKKFNVDGYQFNQEMTKGNDWVFTRKL